MGLWAKLDDNQQVNSTLIHVFTTTFFEIWTQRHFVSYELTTTGGSVLKLLFTMLKIYENLAKLIFRSLIIPTAENLLLGIKLAYKKLFSLNKSIKR